MKNKIYYNNSISEGYYDLIFKKKRGIQSAWHHIKFKYIKNKIHKSKLHLDIGCGPGTFLGLLNKKSIGGDIADNQINYAKKNYLSSKLTFLTYKNRLPLKSQSVDSISLIELIEHISEKDLSFLLNECRRVLKRNGYIVLSTPNYYSLWPIIEIILNIVSPINYNHQHIIKFNKKKLLKFIKKKGFKISELNTFILFSPFLAFISFKLALYMLKFDNFFTKFLPGFLLFLKAKK